MNHDELAFIAELSSVNQDIARYIGRVLDVDGGRVEYSTAIAEIERRLAVRLFALAIALECNAIGRNGEAAASGQVINGETETP